MEDICQTIEPMLAGYALGALEMDESIQVEAHLDSCPNCQEVLAGYRSVGEGLLFALPPQAPPAALRARLLKATLPASAKPAWWARGRSYLVQVFTLTAVLVLLVTNLSLLQRSNRLLETQEALAQQNQTYQTAFSLLTYPDSQVAVVNHENVYGTLVYNPDDTLAVLTVRGLEALPAGQDYQVWLIEPDQDRISGGVFKSVGNEAYTSYVIQSPLALESFIGVGVTIEPEGGSPGPTGVRVLGVEL